MGHWEFLELWNQCRQMSLAFSWKKTFDRACNVFFPMVMATESGRQEDAHEEESSLSMPNKINPKCVGNSLTQLPADRNGVISRPKLASWHSPVANNKSEEQSSPSLDLVTPNGEPCESVEVKLPSANNAGSNNNLKSSDVSPSNLRQLLLLHLDLIHQQQQQIQEKDKEIVQLKTDKEQLEARIKRMERRMAVRGQSGHYNEENKPSLSTPGSAKAKNLLQTRKPSISELIRRKSIPAAAPVLMSSEIAQDVSLDTCLRTETLYLDNENNMRKGNVEKVQEITEQPTTCSISDVPTPTFRVIEKFASPIKTSGTTTRSSVGTVGTEISENLDDETFSKRHQRYETDEKKRKRWDIQRYRALKQREELQEKYKQREDARLKGRKVSEQEETIDDSFVPNCFQIHTVEVSDTVPVTAFGAPVQSFQSSEFDLPWFSLDKRALQEREKLKSKSRGRRKSGRPKAKS